MAAISWWRFSNRCRPASAGGSRGRSARARGSAFSRRALEAISSSVGFGESSMNSGASASFPSDGQPGPVRLLHPPGPQVLHAHRALGQISRWTISDLAHLQARRPPAAEPVIADAAPRPDPRGRVVDDDVVGDEVVGAVDRQVVDLGLRRSGSMETIGSRGRRTQSEEVAELLESRAFASSAQQTGRGRCPACRRASCGCGAARSARSPRPNSVGPSRRTPDPTPHAGAGRCSRPRGYRSRRAPPRPRRSLPKMPISSQKRSI